MKKILSALGIIVICLCSCNNNITNPEVDEQNTNSTLDNEESNCLVNISVLGDGSSWNSGIKSSVDYLVLKSLTIYDKNGKEVGSGNYWGSYYVPYDGTLTIEWNHRGYTDDSWVASQYTFDVKSAHQLNVMICNYNDYCEIMIDASFELDADTSWPRSVSGCVIASFDH